MITPQLVPPSGDQHGITTSDEPEGGLPDINDREAARHQTGSERSLANPNGDYSYLSDGYYASVDARLGGADVLPTPAEALDAYVVPIAVAKARAAGLATPDCRFALDHLPPAPLMVYPINPFTTAGELILDDAVAPERLRSLTYAGKYAVLAQLLPHDHRLDFLRLVMGTTTVPQYEELGRELFRVFRLPLMRVTVVVTATAYLLSAIAPLPSASLTSAEREALEGVGPWRG